ncbi:MAG: hypothetical protein WC479_00745 [Candidatus Izemoplasmatales bacterium]|jgi:hypothetical protein
MAELLDVRKLTNEELVEHLKKVVWSGGWDKTIKEIERRLKKLTELEKNDKA